MRRVVLALAALAAVPGPAAGPLNLAVGQADLKDILRAATTGTAFNLLFDPGLDTRVQGLQLKAATLDELLDVVLPGLGFACQRQGRNLLIRRAEPALRFYHVDQLALSRNGTKSFSVNASGQVIQAGGGGAANTSAYTSSLQMAHNSDPWADLESGLMLLVFGKAVAPAASAAAAGSRSYAGDGRTLLLQPGSGLVGVGAEPAVQARVAAYIQEALARTRRQVLLEARIVEVTLGRDSQLGVDWNGLLSGNGNPASAAFAAGATLNSNVSADKGLLRLVAQSGRVQASLSALARDNRLNVLSAPRLATLNNQKAILRVVREEAYSLPTSQIAASSSTGSPVATGQIQPLIVPVGIVLDIQAQIGDDGVITLAVNPSISEVAEERSFSVPNPGGGSAPLAQAVLPVVDRRDLDTVVRIRAGETLVLAGIIRSKEFRDDRGVPWVRRIPVLGSLFAKQERTQARTELAIFITPTLMEEPQQVQEQRQAAEGRLQAAPDRSRP